MFIPESELIINKDGSIYHLHLKPGDVGSKIITVGDQARVNFFRDYFDKILLEKSNREFSAITGLYKNEKLTVISTGIGTDNVDIVINEIDALFNIDFNTRLPKEENTSLEFIRIGTSGAIKSEIPIDSIVVTHKAIGLDGLLHYYDSTAIRNITLEKALNSNFQDASMPLYAVDASSLLIERFKSLGLGGITLTANGFYGPQSRQLRAPRKSDFLSHFSSFKFDGLEITNFEMESAGIFGLAAILGHHAISVNAILANRDNGEFSTQGRRTVLDLIEKTMAVL